MTRGFYPSPRVPGNDSLPSQDNVSHLLIHLIHGSRIHAAPRADGAAWGDGTAAATPRIGCSAAAAAAAAAISSPSIRTCGGAGSEVGVQGWVGTCIYLFENMLRHGGCGELLSAVQRRLRF